MSDNFETSPAMATLAANLELVRQRDQARAAHISALEEVTTLNVRLARLEREAQVLYEMLCKANELGQESNRVTRAQVERANALRKERFGV